MNETNNGLQELINDIVSGMEIDMPDATLPTPEMLNYYVFEKDRKLFLDQDVGDNCVEFAKIIMRWNQQDKDVPVEDRKPITLYVMSNGGYLQQMWCLVDVMLASKTPITTVCLGMAASAACLIFLAGSTRYMMPRSKLMIHEGSAEFSGRANEVVDSVDQYKEELRQMKQYIVERTSIPAAIVNKKRKDDWYLDAKFCLENGACDKIITSVDEMV